MKRIFMLCLAAVLSVAAASASGFKDGFTVGRGHSAEIVGGWYSVDSTGRYLLFDVNGNLLVNEASKDREHVLEPLKIFEGTIAAGAADTTLIVNLSGYRTVALLVQMSGTSSNAWTTFAFHARYNFAGASDSLSLFTLPVVLADSSAVLPSSQGGGPFARGVLPAAAALADGEFPVTITTTNGTSGAASASLPAGRVVWLRIPGGVFGWPAQCSFRIRNILRSVANTPTVRVWVMGTAL